MRTNIIYVGDNLTILSNPVNFPDKSIDLIYLDPPFFTNKKYEVIWKDGYEIRSFEDRWAGGIENYIAWMEPRLREMHRVLKDTGSIYLHCDSHANAHLRILMDKIFGENNFRNEIIWHYGLGGSSPKQWSSKHDNIYMYSKTDSWFFEPLMIPATSNMMKGQLKKADDVWDIPTINNMAKERMGYPTQKPEALLERIIKASSNPTDIVLDGFCGCGTAIAVAQKLGRRWIGIDVSPTSCKLMANRILKLDNNFNINVSLIGMPKTIEELRNITWIEFQNWVIERLMGRINTKLRGDMGIDGYLFDGSPVQIKQSEHIGRNVVDNFETAMERENKTHGVIVAFSFGSGAIEEVARIKNKNGIIIELKTINELIEL